MDPRSNSMGKTGHRGKGLTAQLGLAEKLGCLRGFGGIVGHLPRAGASVFSDNRDSRADGKPRASIVMCQVQTWFVIKRSFISHTKK